MRAIDLRNEKDFLDQYLALRNSYLDLLLTAPVSREQTLQWLKSGSALVAGLADGAVLLGAVVIYLERDGEVAFFTKEKGRGVGSRLLGLAQDLAAAKGLRQIWAWVRSDNLIAAHVFEKCGFSRAETVVREHGGKQVEGIVFRKAIAITHTQDTYEIRPQAKEFPMMCVLSFVYICNARCPNCPYTNSDIRSTYKDAPVMPAHTFKIIADQCGHYRAWVRISGGGEPMLHPQAVELIEYAKKAGAKVGLITNGSLFTGQSSQRLLEAGVDMIEFSVDAGDAPTYERVRSGLSWDTLVENVRRMIELRKKVGADTKIIASIVNQVGVDVEKAVKFWEPLVDTIQKRKYLTWGINDPAQSADSQPYLAPEHHIPCPFIFERLNIDSRGKVMVCGYDIKAVTDMGNVHTASIKEIWKNKQFEYYRSMHLAKQGHQIPLCAQCPDWKYRSWQHNYWKIVKNAEAKKQARFGKLHLQDMEGCMFEE